MHSKQSRHYVNNPRYSIFPEIEAGGFARNDTTIVFYTRVRAILTSNMRVLDYGAGRGLLKDDPIPFRRDLATLMPHCKQLIAADIDPIVKTNPRCHESVVFKAGDTLPFEDNHFDMIVADWTFEHVDTPEQCASELSRILKPGGWLCARTPNKFSYVGIVASLIPNSFHAKIVKKLSTGVQSAREDEDVFPTAYKMNRKSTMRKLLADFDDFSYYDVETLSYFKKYILLSKIINFGLRFVPRTFYPAYYIFMRKSK